MNTKQDIQEEQDPIQEEQDQIHNYFDENFDLIPCLESFADENMNYTDELERQQNLQTVPVHVELAQICTKQMNEFQTLMNTNVCTKNVPKTIGNNFKKYCEYFQKKMYLSNPSYELPQGVKDFILKKPHNQQSKYGLEDFRELFSSSEESKSIFYYYCTNNLYLDILHSNRQNNPLEFINFIEQYAAGSQAPQSFISSRKCLQIQNKTICKRKKA